MTEVPIPDKQNKPSAPCWPPDSTIAYQALKNEYDFYRRSTTDPVSGKASTAKLKEIYASKSYQLLDRFLRFVDRLRGIKPDVADPALLDDRSGNFPGKTGLPKVALVVDAHGWAFDNVTEQIVRRLSDRYEFSVFYLCDEECNHVAKVLFALKGFDMVHIFWRGYIGNMTSEWCRDYIRDLGGDFDQFLAEYYDPLKISTCVADPLLYGEAYTGEAQLALERAHSFYTTSKKLFDLYSNDPRFPNPAIVIHDFVSFDLFHPENLARFAEIGKRPLRVGWAGNSEWKNHGAGVDLKGVHTIITPAVESLKQQGYAIELHLADRKDGIIPHESMPGYYNSIDVYVCASTQEGTPNPILEAMACGVPIISTDVGVVPEVFGEKQRAFIMPERTPEALEALLKQLVEKPALMEALSRENLESIRPWDWDLGINRYRDYFDFVLSGKKTGED